MANMVTICGNLFIRLSINLSEISMILKVTNYPPLIIVIIAPFDALRDALLQALQTAQR